jgi:hypothetical protein
MGPLGGDQRMGAGGLHGARERREVVGAVVAAPVDEEGRGAGDAARESRGLRRPSSGATDASRPHATRRSERHIGPPLFEEAPAHAGAFLFLRFGEAPSGSQLAVTGSDHRHMS